MERDFIREEKIVLKMTAKALTMKRRPELEEEEKSPYFMKMEPDWEKLLEISENHALTSVVSGLTEKYQFPENVEKKFTETGRRIALQNYHMLFLAKYLLHILEDAGIEAALLKGIGTAIRYPIPELRKSGDIDLILFDSSKLPMADKLLREHGMRKKSHQDANHHIAYFSEDLIELELHTMLTEPFDNQKMNDYLEKLLPKLKDHVKYEDVMGISLPVLGDAYHVYYLLLHMLQHFLRSGFGIRLLCDWTVFWNGTIDAEEVKTYLRLIRESRIGGFASMITSLCIRYMGLSVKKQKGDWLWAAKDKIYYGNHVFCRFFDKQTCRQFLREILDAEEFGKSEDDRMVVLRGGKLRDYLREFHHQMQLNYPKTKNKYFLWPVLWMMTLAKFLYNNKKLRKTSTLEILRKAGDRGRLAEKIHIFR